MKRDKKADRLAKSYEQIPDSLFTIHLKIPQGKIEDFMYFCEVDPAFETVLATSDALAFWKFLMDKSEAYRSNNGME